VLARRWRPLQIYEALLEQDGIHLPHGNLPEPLPVIPGSPTEDATV
jgi:hypothetical protein